MSKSLVVVVFCPQATDTAAAAGAPVNRQVRLQTERMAKDVDLTKTPFDSAQGQAAVIFQNLSADSRALFEGGKQYKVTIEPVE